ncbi:MAG: DUF2330 domain-containing protein [Deltaproteobacteria bacterium]|jgi:hypothetical protein|nr:DUF2330 domain-containing protein [Deltaproteobacteria bacterium]
MTTRSLLALPLAGALVGAAQLLAPADASACGCFAPPDPSVPIVQAGERIVFAPDGQGNITAHIQIQYRGEPQDFGWLLPLPAIPELELGVDEVFTQAIATTQPKYRLTQVAGDACTFGGQFGPRAAGFDSSNENSPPPSPAVKVSSIGPYDYAVLRGDSKQEMLDWLTANRYFIPTGTEDVVGPYIHPGSYFLALKLRKGNASGDIQPVVLKYASDRAMIPIILTSVAADPNMGVQVWVLGNARAIPVNYRHTVINEEYIDWFNAGANYNDVIIAATNEAKDGQSFVTEYAGETSPMVGVLDFEGRFGTRAEFYAISDPGLYASQMRSRGFLFDSNAIAILSREIGMPQALRDQGLTEDQYYQSLDFYLGYDRQTRPEIYEGLDLEFDPRVLTDELFDRIVTPTLAAGQLFRDHRWMTRLYTTLSAEEMTKDPVFSFNSQLPPVSNIHEATFSYLCDGAQNGPGDTRGILALPDGRRFFLNNQAAWNQRDRAGVPYSRRIEVLREEGAPEIELDNSGRISPADQDPDEDGCQCLNGRPSAGLASGILLGLGMIIARRRNRA